MMIVIVAGRRIYKIGAYDDTFALRSFVQIGCHLMRPGMFSSGVEVGRGVIDARLDDLSA